MCLSPPGPRDHTNSMSADEDLVDNLVKSTLSVEQEEEDGLVRDMEGVLDCFSHKKRCQFM